MPYKDREKRRKYDRDYYSKMSSEKKSNKVKLQRDRRRKNACRVIDYLSKNPCVDCGEREIVVLDFDHVSG